MRPCRYLRFEDYNITTICIKSEPKRWATLLRYGWVSMDRFRWVTLLRYGWVSMDRFRWVTLDRYRWVSMGRYIHNPISSSELHLLLPSDNEEEIIIQLCSPTGQIQRYMTLKNGVNSLDVNGLAKGIYALRIVYENEIICEKIMVEN